MTIRTGGRNLALALSALALVTAATVGAPAAPAEAAGRCVDYNYGLGGYSSCVGYIQQLLNYFRGSNPPIAVDNGFGQQTRTAVIHLQQAFGLKVDGVVGPQTWNIICLPQRGPGIPPSFPLAAARAAGCSI